MSRFVLALAALLAACSPSESEGHPHRDTEAEGPFATQTEAPAPDYAKLVKVPYLKGEEYVRRDATAGPPADAKQVGQLWFDRLMARQALTGAGYAGKGEDGPVRHLDVGMTESDFEAWAKANGWPVPRWIAWTFLPSLNAPAVTDTAREGIRIWPASAARTGAQNEALLAGRVELRDGCFWAGLGDGPADKLAFFHGEMGLDQDDEGYYVLVNRVSGQTTARLGEPMNWGGPPTAYIGDEMEAALRKACGDAEILVVGSPESRERLFTNAPHLRDPAIPPAPPN